MFDIYVLEAQLSYFIPSFPRNCVTLLSWQSNLDLAKRAIPFVSATLDVKARSVLSITAKSPHTSLSSVLDWGEAGVQIAQEISIHQ